VNTDFLWHRFNEGLNTYGTDYGRFLNSENINKLEEVAGIPPGSFEFPTGLWAKILYDFAVAYKKGLFPLEDLLSRLVPLYHGKTLSFVLETQAMNTQQVEEFIEDQCLQFEKTKSYLLERWFSG